MCDFFENQEGLKLLIRCTNCKFHENATKSVDLLRKQKIANVQLKMATYPILNV